MTRPRFNYWRDGLFLLACGCYGANQLLFKRWLGAPFLHDYFDDLFLIPCALPPLLWVHSRLGWRPRDVPPRPGEIVGHLVVWSVVIEGIGPRFVPSATGDWRDVVAYAAGAVVALAWWWRGVRGRQLPSTDGVAA